MERKFCRTAVAAAVALVVVSCGGGGGGGTSGGLTNGDGETLSAMATGYALPTGISAVPVDGGGTAGPASVKNFASALRSIQAVTDLPASSDYVKAVTGKSVEERTLEQFNIIGIILRAVAQTHYADAENINAGPYKAMVAWEDERDGRPIKTLEPWVIDSRMIVENGRDVNRVLAWIEEPDEDNPGQTRVIRAEFKVYSAATIGADGDVSNYGEWALIARMDDAGNEYFAATATTENGMTVIRVNESTEGGGAGTGMQGVMYRSGGQGFGRVRFPDWDSCNSPNCTPAQKTVNYAYNGDYLGIQIDGDNPVYKDRNARTDMTRRYGLFYQNANAGAGIAAGDSVERHKSFGFPVSYTDDFGLRRFAYYGAWQGRHQLWSDGGTVAAGTTVVREDRDGGSAQSFTVSAPLSGTLTKRTLVDADVSDILDIAVETWINKHYDLRYDAAANGGQGAWTYCDGWLDYGTWPPVCRDRTNNNPIAMAEFTDYGALIVNGPQDRKFVGIDRWDPNANGGQGAPYSYMYLASDPGGVNYTGAGFYAAEMGPNGPALAPGANRYNPNDQDNLNVNISGSIYIQYTGDFTNGATGWVQKTLESFDDRTWTPVFAAGQDVAFTPARGSQYYINSHGTNYVVKRIASDNLASDYSVQLELQTSANPVNYSGILPTGTAYLRTPWQPEVQLTLVTSASSPDFLKLVYAADNPNTPEDDTGSVYTSGNWGLQAFNNSGQPLQANGSPVAVDAYGVPVDPNARPVEFNWEYSADGGWGAQQYLSDANGYVILSDPVQLQSMQLVNGAGATKTLQLQFDGWMHGLPDLYPDLAATNGVMTTQIADKIVNIPAGTPATDLGGVDYYVKPLGISVFLNVVTANDITTAGKTVPDLGQAAAADLATVPGYTDNHMGAMPTGTVVKYSEGKPVTP